MKMRDEKDRKEKLDDFSDYMRHRLEGHRLPVDTGGWEDIEARMNRKPVSAWWRYGGLAAAVILALVVWLLPVPEMPVERPVLVQERAAGNQPEDATISQKDAVLPKTVSPDRKMIAKVDVKTPVPASTSLPASSLLPEDEVPGIILEDDPEVEIKEAPVSTPIRKADATVPAPDGYRANQIGLSGEEPVKKRHDKRNKWQLGASVGSSGYMARPLGFGSSDDLVNQPSGKPEPPGDEDDDKDKGNGNTVSGGMGNLRSSGLRNITDDLSKFDHSFESYPNVSYSLPISFGFTARKSLNGHIGLESGLVYTFLSTSFRQTGMYRTEVRSRLHYLGIPVNLVVNLWDHSRWNVYLSGGVMIEKGILAVYDEHKFGKELRLNRTVKERIGGLQWSVNASVGVGYRIYRDWSLYLEPRFSYYFNSGQPASIRTDRPLGFGLNAGIRVEF